jgi:aminopeptidase
MFMKDPRIDLLAKNLIEYSVGLKKGEKILIENIGGEIPLTQALMKHAYEVGGIPYLTIKQPQLMRTLIENGTKEQLSEMANFEISRMKSMQAYIGIRSGENASEMGSVSSEKMKLYMEYYQKPLHSDTRVKQTRWCVLRYPNHSMAQLAGISTEYFEDFYFNVCNLDYQKMSKAMDPLVELMDKTNQVRITGKNTDLTFSIKGLKGIKCSGTHNIPDGEVFTAPIKDSVNGFISYNVPSQYQGTTFENITFHFQHGKIINATANDSKRLNEILDTDEGARFIGEFAIGLNPTIEKPMNDILFDEKIKGSFHFTPGSCYEECNNGNSSSIHWDLVMIQRPEYGGGEIFFDNKLIRKDGLFVLEELKDLNPENLV